MKNLTLIFFLLAAVSCKKETTEPAPTVIIEPKTNPVVPETTIVKDQKLVLAGDFMAAVHPTVGTVKIFEDNKTKKLSLELLGFKTDAGPDLRIYVAEDAKATNFMEITDKVKNGDSIHEIPAGFDPKKQLYVLIWCKQFSVLFGSAKLK